MPTIRRYKKKEESVLEKIVSTWKLSETNELND